MAFKDVFDGWLPNIFIIVCIIILICCIFKTCKCGMTADELREIRERHLRQIIENEIQLQRQLEILQQQDNEELEEAFRAANINRLNLTNSLANYARCLKEKIKREEEQIKGEEIMIFVNPGDEKPVLGRLLVD